jgi:hypothetical protein
MKTMKFHFVKAMGNHGAPIFFRLIFLGAMLVASHVCLADTETHRVNEANSKEAYEVTDVRKQIGKQSPDDIKVTIASDIQAKLDKLSLQKKGRVEGAIKNGALFMQLYLFGLACDTTSPYWDEDMGDVVAMNSADWNYEVCKKFEPQKVLGYGPISRATRLVCSKVILSDFQIEDGAVSLSYQTTSLGAVILGTEYEAFISPDSGEGGQISITVNADDRVFKVVQTDKTDQNAYSRTLNGMKWDVANTDEYLKHPVPVIGKSITSIDARNRRYKTLIKQIEHQAGLVCN